LKLATQTRYWKVYLFPRNHSPPELLFNLARMIVRAHDQDVM
jgi:hypothetical protein